jgi:hypothetical protein
VRECGVGAGTDRPFDVCWYCLVVNNVRHCDESSKKQSPLQASAEVQKYGGAICNRAFVRWFDRIYEIRTVIALARRRREESSKKQSGIPDKFP